MKIKKYPKEAEIEIMGHKFNGLEDIEKAVEIATRISNSIGERYLHVYEPEKPVEGIHVLKLYEPYPCFDSEDYLYEKRRYCNYFFSPQPFSKEDIERLAAQPARMDYCMVTEDMDPELPPSVYFGGTSTDPLLVAVRQ